jgi:hypothetical protein
MFFKLDECSWVFEINTYSYLIFNWLELLLLVLICFKIRNVKDELSIITELLWISGFWIACSFIYFLLFSLPFQIKDPSQELREKLAWGIFLTI